MTHIAPTQHVTFPPPHAPYRLRRFVVCQREGTGAMQPATQPGNKATALSDLDTAYQDYKARGYDARWHGNGTWFDATREAMPTVYAVVWESES